MKNKALSTDDVHKLLDDMCILFDWPRTRIPYTFAYDFLREESFISLSRADASEALLGIYPDKKERLTLIYKLAVVWFLKQKVSVEDVISITEFYEFVSNVSILQGYSEDVSVFEVLEEIYQYNRCKVLGGSDR